MYTSSITTSIGGGGGGGGGWECRGQESSPRDHKTGFMEYGLHNLCRLEIIDLGSGRIVLSM